MLHSQRGETDHRKAQQNLRRPGDACTAQWESDGVRPWLPPRKGREVPDRENESQAGRRKGAELVGRTPRQRQNPAREDTMTKVLRLAILTVVVYAVAASLSFLC
jgi:hypothetical protein